MPKVWKNISLIIKVISIAKLHYDFVWKITHFCKDYHKSRYRNDYESKYTKHKLSKCHKAT